MEIDRYVRYQRQLLERRAAMRARLAAELNQRLPALAAALAAKGARKVVLFGSLATGNLTEDSDVDVAVEGLPSGELIEAITEASRIVERPVDVVRIETASPRLRARIETEGELLHAR